jgi:hypothetical protein
MKKEAWFLILVLLVACTRPGEENHREEIKNVQVPEGQFTRLFAEADSVLLVSHELTAGVTIVDEQTGQESLPEPIVVENRLNRKIVRESALLKGENIAQLGALLDRPFADRQITVARCFLPHHAIIVVNKGKASYLDICFDCRRVESSPDIQIDDGDFDTRKWKELLAFFQRQGLQYELAGIQYE